MVASSDMPEKVSDIVARLRAFAKKWGAAEGDQQGELALANEAAASIDTLQRERDEATEQWQTCSLALDSMQQNRDTLQRHFDECTVRTEAAEAEVTRLRGVLKPFARLADMTDNEPAGASITVNVDRCRDARSAYSKDTP